MDLAKDFDCLPHDLLTAKLWAWERITSLTYVLLKKSETISQDKGNQKFVPINKIRGSTRVKSWTNSLQHLYKLFTLPASK